MMMGQLSLASLVPGGRPRAFSLVSGSSGNSTFVGRDSTKVLIDCGVSAKRLTKALAAHDEDPATLSGIMITHEHHDHMAGLSVLARRHGLPVYMPRATWEVLAPRLKFAERLDVHFIEPGIPFEIGDLAVMPFRTSHDAVCPVGYRIDTGCASIALATDTGYLTESMMENLVGSDLIFIEANYDPTMLYEGSYPWPLKKRIDSERGHLSNQQSATAIGRLIEAGTTRFVLSHLSKENNRPTLALHSVTRDLSRAGFVEGRDHVLRIAPRYEPSALWEL